MSRIAIFIPSLKGGGAERVMVTLANSFAARGHEVDLVLSKVQGPYLSEVSPLVRIVDLDRSRAHRALVPLARYLKRTRPDAMLSALNYANIIAILAHIIARVDTRLVVSERNSLASLEPTRLAKIMPYLMRVFYPRADHIVAVSKGIADEQVDKLGLPGSLVTAIPNPLDLDKITGLAKERPEHSWLEAGAVPVILAVGSLSAQKDYPTLIEAFAKLRTEREVRLVILGEGERREDLEKKIAAKGLSGSVLLGGFQANPFGWMAACKVYVMSSLYEGFPNSLVQAMACGARVVSTDCPTGPSEILEDGRWGRLVPPRDVEGLYHAIRIALDDPDYPRGLQRVKQFQIDSVVSAYGEVLGIPETVSSPTVLARMDAAESHR